MPVDVMSAFSPRPNAPPVLQTSPKALEAALSEEWLHGFILRVHGVLCGLTATEPDLALRLVKLEVVRGGGGVDRLERLVERLGTSHGMARVLVAAIHQPPACSPVPRHDSSPPTPSRLIQ